MKPEIIVLLSALGGVLIAQLGSIIISIITKRFEQKSELKKLIVTTGIAHWKETVDFAERQKGGAVVPLTSFIINISMVADLIGKGLKIKEKDVEKILKKNYRITDLILKIQRGAKKEENKKKISGDERKKTKTKSKK